MTPDLIGAYAAAGVALIGAVTTAVVTILGARKAAAHANIIEGKVDATHLSVNGNLVALNGRIAQLTASLTQAGVRVPVPEKTLAPPE